MDYTVLAREYMEVLFQMRNRKASKRITDSMHGEHVMLSYLSHHDGIGIPSEISSELGVSTARIAATLNSLETKGLITRRIDEQDRRRILVELTALGKEKESNHAKRIMGVMRLAAKKGTLLTLTCEGADEDAAAAALEAFVRENL